MSSPTARRPGADLMTRRRQLLGPCYRLFYDEPVHPVRAAGVWLYDADGNAYLDVYNNVPCVGHCHPRVVQALSAQAATLNTHTRYLDENILHYAERLLGKLPADIGHVMFTCTGSEANDLALRIARHATGGSGIIVTNLAYHGGTIAVAEISPSLVGRENLGGHVRTVAAPDAYRRPDTDLAAFFADEVRAACRSLEEAGIRPAALIVDTIFSSDGVFADPAGCLRPAVEVIRNAGGLFIADEVQAGFARTGDAFWGFERHAIVPDIVTMGKPMGNGHPIAGLAVKPALVDGFGQAFRYFNTFGGNPVSTAVGAAVLDVIEDEALQQNARQVGTYMREKILTLGETHALIGDVRGAGLFTGIELVRDRRTRVPATEETARLVNGMRRERVLISSTGVFANCLKVRPPLVFSRDDADHFLRAFDKVLTHLR